MRTGIIFISAVIVLGGGLFAYVAMQPAGKPRPLSAKPLPVTRSTTGSNKGTSGVLGPGDDVWVQTYDRKTGDLASKFRADRYDTPKDGLVNVVKPEAQFFLGGGQLLTVEAETGKVVMPQSKKRANGMDGMQAAPPDRGDLQVVTVSLYANEEDEEPTLVCTLPNITFDNDTLRLATAATEIDGKMVPADRIPVRVRGEDYDFDGYGLVIRWNQRDRHLEQLEIAHGEQLTVKNAGDLMNGQKPLPQATAPTPSQDSVFSAPALWLPVTAALVGQVATDAPAAPPKPNRKKRPRPPAPASKPAAPPRVAVAYRAIFSDDVVIQENDRPVGHADQLSAVFNFETKKSAAESTTRPATAPTSTPAATRPTTRKARGAGGLFVTPVARPSGLSTPAPATRPDTKLVIRWTGKLIVLPIEMAASGLKTPKDRIIELFGSPVRLDRDGASLRAATVRSHGETGFEAKGSNKYPKVLLYDPSGVSLETPVIVFNDATGEAVMTGDSAATLPLDRAPATRPTTQPAGAIHARWKTEGRLTLGENAAGEHTISRADFSGDVRIEHPQLNLDADTLALQFAPGTGEHAGDPSLTSALATGHVAADLLGNDNTRQKLQTDKLTLDTTPQPDGSVAVKGVTAEGNVVAFDDKQKLSAQKLVATIGPKTGPSTRPADAFASGQLERLTASGAVHFTSSQGATAASDELSIVPANTAGQRITLTGVPASVSDGKSTLRGLAIVIEPDSRKANVAGAGVLQSMIRMADGDIARPVTIAWTDGMDVDADQNRVTLQGGVQADMTDRDGAVQSAKGGKLILTLADAPKSATEPATKPSQTLELASGKVVKKIDLEGNVELSSILSAADGTLLRRVHLFAPSIQMSAGESGDVSAVLIPAAGRMLYDDQRPATTRPAAASVGALQNPLSTMQGATAVEWKKQMRYDPTLSRITLEQDVQVVHKDPGGEPMRLAARTLILDLDKSPGIRPAADQRASVRLLTATGGISFSAPKVRFDAADLMLDPKANLLTARGSARQPVEVYDESGVSSGSFEEGVWNLATHQLVKLKNFAGELRN